MRLNRQSTYTYAELEVPRYAYDAVRQSLIDNHPGPLPFDVDVPDGPIDLTGIALVHRPRRSFWRWLRGPA